jgi:membrane protein implicated in regulation of membrane protease activity
MALPVFVAYVFYIISISVPWAIITFPAFTILLAVYFWRARQTVPSV